MSLTNTHHISVAYNFTQPILHLVVTPNEILGLWMTLTNCQDMTLCRSCPQPVWELTEKIMQIAKIFSNDVSCFYDHNTLNPFFAWHYLDSII